MRSRKSVAPTERERIQLTAALDGPLLLYLTESEGTSADREMEERFTRGWQDFARRITLTSS